MTLGSPHPDIRKTKENYVQRKHAAQFRSINIVAKNVNCLFTVPFTVQRLTSQFPKTDVIHLHIRRMLRTILAPALDD